MREIEAKLEACRLRMGDYPTTEQGLAALVTRPEGLPDPDRWRQQFRTLPKDPWGNDYQYKFPGSFDPEEPEIICVGADGRLGTEDDTSSQDQTD